MAIATEIRKRNSRIHLSAGDIAYTICWLCMFLFVFTAVSKIVLYDEFTLQLGKSPITNPYAGFLLWAVPGLEILVGVCLVIPVTFVQRIALYAFFTLMSGFTVYIALLTSISEDVPCGCIGISEKLSIPWHIALNILFTGLAVLALRLTGLRWQVVFAGTISCAVMGSLVVYFGYRQRLGAHPEQHPFARHMMHAFNEPNRDTNLGVNSYYYAGTGSDGYIYLGNGTAPFHLLRIDRELRDTQHVRIQVADTSLSQLFAPKAAVRGNHFYLMDGIKPAILKGEIGIWQADRYLFDSLYFNAAVPMGSGAAAVRILSNRTDTYALAKENHIGYTLAPSLLEKQVDGKFCMDGMLRFDPAQNLVIYTYYYRNQFIVADSNLTLLYRGRTLDTTAHARVKVSISTKDGSETLSAPTTVVNKSTATALGKLFIHSSIMGLEENESDFVRTATIDVYDLTNGTYRYSFRLPKRGKYSMREFWIDENSQTLYALYGKELVSFPLLENKTFINDILPAGKMPVTKPAALFTTFLTKFY